MASPLRALAFDAYGTLFDVFSVTRLCERCFPGHGAAVAQLWRTKQLQYSVLRSLMDRYADFGQITRDGLFYAARALRLDLTPEAGRALMDAYQSLDAFPDVAPGLEALRRLGFRLAILSNGEPGMLAAAVAHAGIGHLLDAIVSADEVRVFKPSPHVYRRVAARLDLDPSHIGFVSSNSWDINGAASAGLATFWIRRTADQVAEELGWHAGRTVSTIIELADCLNESAEDSALC